MISLAIVSLLAGAVLGWWFTIPILVVAIIMALVVVAEVGAAVASLWWIALDVFVVTMCLARAFQPMSCSGRQARPQLSFNAANLERGVAARARAGATQPSASHS